ncbi:MAG: hypothetical protein NC548_24135 [Lachnospiraceae bacterium]|nr:hypothetical protein [Lachnospiraceae bacterium]
MIQSKNKGQDRKILLAPLTMIGKWEYIIPMALLCVAAGYSVCNACGFLFFPDEYTYWSYAAAAAGDDWSAVTSLGLYFSYGYSAVLIPAYFLFRNPVTAYRVVVGVNFILLFVSFLCLAKFSEKMQQKQNVRTSSNGIPVVFLAAAAVFFPGHLFSAQMTMTETMILTLYIVSGVLLYRYLEENSTGMLVLLLLSLFYLYVVHMRTVGVLLSAFVVLVFHCLSRRGRRTHLLWIIGIMGVLLLGSHFVKEWAYANVFGGLNAEFVRGNDYSGQLGKIRYLFTSEGFYDLFVHIVGKLLYLGQASYGLFYWGVYSFGKRLFPQKASEQRGEEAETNAETRIEDREFGVYILLTIAAQIMIAAVYLLTMGESSDYTYGRYSEIILPFVMLEGMLEIWRQRAKIVWAVSGVIAVVQAAAAWLVVKQIAAAGKSVFKGYFMVGMSYLYHGEGFEPGIFYRDAYLFGTFLMVAVAALLLWCRSKKSLQFLLTILLLMQLALAVRADSVFLQPFKRAANRDYRLARKIEELYEVKDDPRVIYRNEAYPPFIGILQFMLRDITIEVTDEVGDVREDDILIFSFDDAEQDQWEDEFANKDARGHFTILYN